MSTTLLDTGPLVAFLNRTDRWHGKSSHSTRISAAIAGMAGR